MTPTFSTVPGYPSYILVGFGDYPVLTYLDALAFGNVFGVFRVDGE